MCHERRPELHHGRRCYNSVYTLAFVWDEKKDLSNQRKHGVSSETAVRVFTDPDAVSYLDRIADGEKRWHTIGLARSHSDLTRCAHS